jgi:MFS family permease
MIGRVPVTPTAPPTGLVRRQQALVAVVQVLALGVWFSATAVAPALQRDWGLSAAASVWLTASVQLGFAAGAVTSSVLNLPDRFPPHLVLSACAAGAATCTALVPLLADGLGAAVPLRVLTGAFLAGVYPVGMKLMASWTPSASRGRAFGVLIGSLTLGSALPHLIRGLADLPWRGVLWTAAVVALGAAVIGVALIRPGPLLQASARPQARYALAVFGDRLPRLANLGYFGHMWELYAFWTWLPLFLAASRQDSPTSALSLLTFATIGLAGFTGAVLGGRAADRWGRAPAAATALVVSGGCCLLAPAAYVAPWPVLLVFLAVWGASVIADSGVFSTALSETADQRYVGTALTVQTAIGFTLTVLTIQLLPLVADAVTWQYAFWVLAPGPLLGAVAMVRFGRFARAAT